LNGTLQTFYFFLLQGSRFKDEEEKDKSRFYSPFTPSPNLQDNHATRAPDPDAGNYLKKIKIKKNSTIIFVLKV
jgi:hypothetical protein